MAGPLLAVRDKFVNFVQASLAGTARRQLYSIITGTVCSPNEYWPRSKLRGACSGSFSLSEEAGASS